MEKNLPIPMQEVIVSSSNVSISKQISKLEKSGKLRKIAPRIYTPNFTDSPETIIRQNLFTILGKLYPGAVLSHRSAIEFQPTANGHIFISYTYTKKIALPGVTLNFLAAPGAIEGDNPLSGALYVSQLERALLENLQVSRKQQPDAKTLPLSAIEDRLEQVIRVKGEMAINELREKARSISEQLDMKQEFEKLTKLISALLSTYPSNILSSPLATARAFGNPYDPARLSLFEALFKALMQQEFISYTEQNTTHSNFTNFAFFEAYFSNYIEGTEFELEEAKKIVDTNVPLPTRHEDSHDILGTYKIVSNQQEMSIIPTSPDHFIELLLQRHAILIFARLSKNPGQFKDKNNRAGETFFVDKTLVKGTLSKGFEYYQALIHPFSKAAFMMYLISEVHPFLDGNGRVARVMMNAEMVAANQSRIIIPTVYREDYLSALRKLSRQGNPEPYIRMLLKAWTFSSKIVGNTMMDMEHILNAANAFKDPEEGRLIID